MAFDRDEEAEAKVPLQSAKSPQIVISTNNADFAATSTANKANGINNDNTSVEYSATVVDGAPASSYQKMELSGGSKKRLTRRESHAFAFGFSTGISRFVRRVFGGKDDVTPEGELQIVDESQPPLYRTTPRRWLMLTVFAFYSMSNAFQWVEYAIISDKIMYFYDVSLDTVNWTSMIFMLTYIPLVFPATWLLDKKGLRVVALIGAFGNFLGASIKCFSAYPGGFVVTFVGQTISAVSQIFILGLPARLAAVWFSAAEVSFATAIGVFGNQVGVAIGFLLPPMLVPGIMVPGPNNTTEPYNHNSSLSPDHNASNCPVHDLYGQNLANMFYGSAAINGFLFLVVLFAFQDKPRYPPSPAQAAILLEAATTTYFNWVKVLIKNWNFIILVISYGINTGVFYAIGTLLNECILHFYPGESENAGRIGVTIVFSGLIGSFIGGLWLSWSGNYKTTTFIIYLLSFLSMIVFTIVLSLSLWIVFVVAACLGFFMTGYLPVGFEFAAEITYPAPEGTSSGLLNCSSQLFGLILTYVMSVILKSFDPIAANGFLGGCLFVGTVMTFFIKSDLRRTTVTNAMNANKSSASLAASAGGNVPQIHIENIQMVPNESKSKHDSTNNAVFAAVGNNDL